ncbi:MAG: hypothetical protein IKA20_04270 [Clostridia bacterium]|nr:hypothetical protein [Clostridia bacterium]
METLFSVIVNAGFMRSLISPLQGVINALLNGQLVAPCGCSTRLELLATAPFTTAGRSVRNYVVFWRCVNAFGIVRKTAFC